MRICTVEGCPQHKATKICGAVGCSNVHHAKGYCSKHYTRLARYGDLDYVKNTVYSTPEEAFAARTEWRGDCLIWTGTINNKGYGVIAVQGTNKYAHRYAWERENGPIPEGKVIDHKDHCDTRCCNVNHLRATTQAKNMQNRSKPSKSSKTGEINIHPYRGRYIVTIRKDGVQYRFGSFDTIEEAKPVRDKARETLFGKYRGLRH